MADAAPLDAARLVRAKIAYAARRAQFRDIHALVTGEGVVPHAGDLLLARVGRIGQHRRIELRSGRRALLFEGDEIVLCYGNRYAPDQFEAYVPNDLGPCHMAAAGGVAGRVVAAHLRMKAPTEILPLGLLGDRQGRVVNLYRYALKPRAARGGAPVFAVVGTSMNAGKTSAAAALVRGLTLAGFKVGAAKVTGTGAGGDLWHMTDAGAAAVLDFTDAGHASTYLADDEALKGIFVTLTGELDAEGVDVIVVEIADGLNQLETARLAASDVFRERVVGVVFAAADAMGARAGSDWLARHRLPLLAVSGLVTASPLARRETVQTVSAPVLGLDDLVSPERIEQVFRPAMVGLRPVGRSPALAAPEKSREPLLELRA
jgi:molybdopterin-guanine dinucleotide biosynthesis protein